MMLRKIR